MPQFQHLYPSAENVFCRIHATDIDDDDFADLALSDSLDAFRLSLAHVLTRRADSDLFFTPYNCELVGHGLEPDLHMPGDGILNLSMGYAASISIIAAENSVYHSCTVSLDLRLQPLKGLQTGGCPECQFEGQGSFGLLEVVREGGRGEGERGGGEFLWRAKLSERGRGKGQFLIKLI